MTDSTRGSTHPWFADRELDVAGARETIRSQFPEISADRVTFVGSGWDNDVFLVDERWVFRFPRRRIAADGLEREAAAMALGAEALSDLGVAVPEVEFWGDPGRFFPYPFMGYERLPGSSAPDLPDLGTEARELGAQLGRVLSCLHRVPEKTVHCAGIGEDPEGAEEWYAEAVSIADDLEEREWPDLGEPLEWLWSGPRRPPKPEAMRFLHNDLCPDHVLLSGGRITGLLDFGDAALGDPALDFVMLPAWLGPEGAGAALDAYDLPVDHGFADRVTFLSRVTSLSWLHDAHLEGADTEKHREWVRRAFLGS